MVNQWCTGCKLSAVCLSTDYITALRVQVTQRGGASYKVFQAELHFGFFENRFHALVQKVGLKHLFSKFELMT